LVALGPRGFSAEPAYLGEGSCHPLEQVCEGIRRAGSCTWGYIPQKQLDSWTARAFLWPEATWDLSAPSPSVTEGSPEEDAVAIPCMIMDEKLRRNKMSSRPRTVTGSRFTHAAHSATVTPPGQRDAMFVAKNPKSGSRIEPGAGTPSKSPST